MKKEGVPSLSRASQKRKANAETITDNESVESKLSSSSKPEKIIVIDRELDLAERVQKRDESDRVLTLLKENLIDADSSPERLLAKVAIKRYREHMILALTIETF